MSRLVLPRRKLLLGTAALAAPAIIKARTADACNCGTGGGPGPTATGTFTVSDFTNLTGKTVDGGAFGVASATWFDGTANGATVDGQLATTPAFQAASKAFNPQLLRLHCGATFWPDAFANLNSPNFTGPNNAILNLNKCVDLTKCKVVVGIGGSVNGFTTNLSVADFANMAGQIAQHFATTPGTDGKIVTPFAYEIMNETDAELSFATYNSYFQAAAAAIHAKTPNIILTGPASDSSTNGTNELIQANTASVLGMPNLHTYLYCPGLDTSPLDANVSQGENTPGQGSGTSPEGYAGGINASIAGNYAANLPWLQGEYNVGCGPNDPAGRDQNIIGACFAISWIFKVCSIANTLWFGGQWEYGPSGGIGGGWGQLIATGSGSEYGNTQYSIQPAGAAVSQGGMRCPGKLVSVTAVPTGMECWATVNGTSMSTVIVNSAGNGAKSGKPAFSHWPLNASGTGNIHMWQSSPANPIGVLTSVSVTAGVLTNAVTFPDTSVTIFYP